MIRVISLTGIDEKVLKVFGDLAVEKSLARLEIVSRLPRFIAEYLISKYYQKDPKNWMTHIIEIVNEYFPDPREKDKILSKAKREGKITLIDEYKVYVSLKRNMYYLQIPNLQINDALVSDTIVSRYERILSGLWGIGTLEYRPELLENPLTGRNNTHFTPLVLVDFAPFQVYNIDPKIFIEGRSKFTTEEWINFLIKSIGLNPDVYSKRQKILLLFRIVPLVEGNVNLLELGPRATGKTYLYRNISYYTRIYAGGTVSAARLIYDARMGVLGDIGTRDVVIFDEIAKVKFTNPDEIVSKLKDYMVDGFFERGQLKRAHSDCSLVFIGNIEMEEGRILGDVKDYLPNFMKDTAFLDRIHGLLPGWELPKILKSETHLAKGYGLAADALSELFHRLRTYSLEALVNDHIELVGNYTIRDEKAVRKLLSGIIKLVFPNGEFNKTELQEIANVAAELRQSIANVLTEMAPYEFPKKELSVKVRG